MLTTFVNDGLTFDVADSGGDGEVVILLHGFPATKESWDTVTPHLVDAGYRVLAPDQRGYSPGARPPGRRSYTVDRLIGDTLALADAAGAGAGRFHLVGHDWGGAVAWGMALAHPERLATMTSLATPHPRAMARSMASSTQAFHSWYVLFYQLPLVPEMSVTSGPGSRMFKRTLLRSGLPEHRAETYLRRMQDGAVGPAINWYRALPFNPPQRLDGPVAVPTLYIYADGDFALTRRAADLTADHVTGPYRYEVLEGVSHWIPEEAPDVVAPLLLEHFSEHPARPAA